jgi:hypothetical protein
MSSEPCKRIVLSGAEGCRVTYCEDCKVAEIEVGAVSLRLHVPAFEALSDILSEAAAKLNALHRAQAEMEMDKELHYVH